MFTFITKTIWTPIKVKSPVRLWMKIREGARTSDVDKAGIIHELSIDVVHGHMTHEEHESDPRHPWSLHVQSDEISSSGADEDCTDTGP